MASKVSALSSVVAKGHQAIHFVSSTPSYHAVRRVFPSTVGSQPRRSAPFRSRSRLRLTGSLRSFHSWLCVQESRFAAVPTGPWLSAVYHVRACKRYYGLMRRSDELRPAWACSAYSGRSLPLRAVRLTFPSLAVVYGRACPGWGLPQPGSAMTTRPNHPSPRQVLHLQVCQRLKPAHRNLVFGAPACTWR
jgi:hypothetical protein